MSEWLHYGYPSGELSGPKTGYRWRYSGEVTLSLVLRRDYNSIGRFEIARILDNPIQATILFDVVDREDAIKATSEGKTFVDEPFWQGLTPQELEEFCQESMLPLPPRYIEYWESFKNP